MKTPYFLKNKKICDGCNTESRSDLKILRCAPIFKGIKCPCHNCLIKINCIKSCDSFVSYHKDIKYMIEYATYRGILFDRRYISELKNHWIHIEYIRYTDNDILIITENNEHLFHKLSEFKIEGVKYEYM